jgi:eukaryotic-like serine/threonine-protein kinase
MTSPPPLAEGMVIANRFRLDRLLGQGGMGSVWAAWHITLNVEVAVKFIDAQTGLTQDAWSRFSQEAMAAAKIKSPHVVSILDFGTDEHRRPYIAMELLQGEELASRLENETALPIPVVARIMAQACKGLARAHAAGIVHRDIKPDNIFLVEDEDGFLLKILDFGIAKMASVGGPTHKTGTGQVLGTPLYMSPEQAYGNKPVDHRTDLYSMAVVAYRCLAGQVPFNSDGVGELIVAITTQEPTPPSWLRAGLPAGIDAWFQRALAKDPAARFTNAREMNDTFLQACGLAHTAESTAQFSALSFEDMSAVMQNVGPISSPSPLIIRRGSLPSGHQIPPPAPSQRRPAETLQGTMVSFEEAGVMPPRRKRWWIGGTLSLLLAGSAGAVFLYGDIGDTGAQAAPGASAAAVQASASASAESVAKAAVSAPVISINSLPADTAPRHLKPYPRGTNGLKGAGTAAHPLDKPGTASTSKPAPLPSPTNKNDYGL